MEFSRQEYWSVLPFPLPGDLPDPRIEHGSPESPTLVGGFLTLLHLKSLSLLFKTKVGGSDSKESASDERDLDQEDPLEKGTATHSSILAWGIPRTEQPGRLQSIRLQRNQT